MVLKRCDYDMDSFLNKHGLYLPHNVRVSLVSLLGYGWQLRVADRRS